MTVSDAVLANITTLYLGVIAVMKALGVMSGRSFSGWFVVAVSTTVVGIILVGSLTWDVSRKVTYILSSDQTTHKNNKKMKKKNTCRGGICWHGVSEVRLGSSATVSLVRFQFPHHPI